EPSLLKQQGKQPGEKSHFAETGGVQSVIESWVKGFTEYPPKQKDVDHKNHCYNGVVAYPLEEELGGAEENHDESSTAQSMARAWWEAFWEVKAKVDIAARRCLGLSSNLLGPRS
ncbi:hypothetical protein C8R48DRAFT_297185, partial [Suillus tomentosus]